PTRGKRTTLGSYAYEHWVPERSALLVERLLGAGAIMVGKTTTPEFAYSSFTESPLWGITRNPWDETRTPGGSSGGSGTAVASGPDERDVMSLAPPLDLSEPIEPSVEGMRLALDVDLGCYGVAPEVERAVRDAAEALAGAGAVVEEVDVGWGRDVADAWVAHWGVYLAAIFGDKLEDFRERMDPPVGA